MDAMHLEIQKLFIDGVHEVFYTLFNDGIHEGVYFYPQIEQSKNVYQEIKGKVYGNPVLLVSKVQLNHTSNGKSNLAFDERDSIEVIRSGAIFTVPYKTLVDNGINISENNYTELQKGIMRYKDTFFTIESISPTAFVEQVFLLYNFNCRECIGTDLDEISFKFIENFEEEIKVVGEEDIE